MVSKIRMASYIQFLWQPLNIVILMPCLGKGAGYSTALLHAGILLISSLYTGLYVGSKGKILEILINFKGWDSLHSLAIRGIRTKSPGPYDRHWDVDNPAGGQCCVMPLSSEDERCHLFYQGFKAAAPRWPESLKPSAK